MWGVTGKSTNSQRYQYKGPILITAAARISFIDQGRLSAERAGEKRYRHSAAPFLSSALGRIPGLGLIKRDTSGCR